MESAEVNSRTLEGRKVLVTGGGVGIGRGIVRHFAEAGALVAFTTNSRDPGSAASALSSLGLKTIAMRLDATRSEDVNEVVNEAADRLGGIDVVVNNAGGLVGRRKLLDMSDDHWSAVWNVNVTSTIYVTRAALNHLGSGGRVLNISSLAGRNGGGDGAVAYATAKAAIDGFTRALAKEVAAKGITVNAIAPGLILDTPFHDTFTPAEDRASIIAGIPAGRAGFPPDVAAAAEYFARSDSGFTTGVVLDLNGGAFFG